MCNCEQQVEEAVREKIICAAVRASDGYVFRGQWHATAMYSPFGLQGMPKYKDEQPHGDDQGFVTSTGRYVTREEAWTIAEAAGQLNDRPDKTPGTLYSEDLDYAVTPTTKTSMKPPKRDEYFSQTAYEIAWYSYWATVISIAAICINFVALLLLLR